jgi:PIN domain nuclease of toxin-antitoxin system
MDLLLDTHTFLWFITGDNQLPDRIVKQIVDKENNCFVSIASIWEIVIKLSIDKLEVRGGFETIEDFLDNNDLEILPISFSHTKRLLKLPHHHNDPFDRMIISQSLVDKMPIISKDRFFKDYNVKVIW